MTDHDTKEIIVRQPAWQESDLALICGITNAGGGSIIVTLNGRGNTKKMRRYRKTFELIPRLTQTELGLTCTTEPIMDGSQLGLEIKIPAARTPVEYRGTYYLFTNDENTVIDEGLLAQLLEKEQTSSWEMRIQPLVRQEDLDSSILSQLTNVLDDRRDSESTAFIDERETVKALELYGLRDAHKGVLTNIGVLLLHRSPQDYIPGAQVRIGIFDEGGKEVEAPIALSGPLTSQLRDTIDTLYDIYLPRALRMQTADATDIAALRKPSEAHDDRSESNEEQEAIDPALLPPRDAVREAVLNALVHKDYESGLPISISVHPYQLHINNVGRPPSNWSTEDLQGRHSSRPNNPALAYSLIVNGLFNGWGNGTTNMIRACQEIGVPRPRFTLRPDETEVTFAIGIDEASTARQVPKDIPSAPTGIQAALHRLQENDPRNDADSANTKRSSPQKTTFKDHSIAAANRLDLTSTDEYVLKVIATNGRVTAPRIAEVLGVSESTVRRSFRKLRELELIERIGSNKAGYWRLID